MSIFDYPVADDDSEMSRTYGPVGTPLRDEMDRVNATSYRGLGDKFPIIPLTERQRADLSAYEAAASYGSDNNQQWATTRPPAQKQQGSNTGTVISIMIGLIVIVLMMILWEIL